MNQPPTSRFVIARSLTTKQSQRYRDCHAPCGRSQWLCKWYNPFFNYL